MGTILFVVKQPPLRMKICKGESDRNVYGRRNVFSQVLFLFCSVGFSGVIATGVHGMSRLRNVPAFDIADRDCN